ncbi:hypothetical protein F4X73_02280 [Candidatus Poribacteria bacterium]|nr:hypothetical protein [Candidatus Poribacteria bacterium]
MIKRVLILFAAFSLLGCAYKSTNEIMNSWMGSHISQVIQSWGPPNQITEDGAGGKIYIWQPEPIPLPPEPSIRPGTNTREVAQDRYYASLKRLKIMAHNNRYKMFYVRPNGIIYHWRAQ